MKRTGKLLVGLAVLACGVALVASAGDATSAVEGKPCCGSEKAASPKVGTNELTCLQTPVYVDGVASFWLADCYDEAVCTNTPYPTYLWAPSDLSAPQFCDGEPGCSPFSALRGVTDPVLQKPLPKGTSYIDNLKLAVHYPGLPADRTWDPKDAVKDLGELKVTFVKVKNVHGQYFAVRLSAGIAEMGKIRFPADAVPVRPKIVDRKILIGFEVEMDDADVAKLKEATPTSWKRYESCPTAFVLKVENSEYYVTVTAANPVKVPEKLSQPATKKSGESK